MPFVAIPVSPSSILRSNWTETLIEFRQTVVLKFKRPEKSQWCYDPDVLAHLEGLVSLWMYSFIYKSEPGIHYDETFDIRSWFKSYLEGQVLDDYLVHIGGEKELAQLRKLGVQLQNIVAIGKTENYLDTNLLPRRYIPVFSVAPRDNQHWWTHGACGPNKNQEPKEMFKTNNEPNFVPTEHLFGRPQSSPETKYAYKYPSTSGKTFISA